MGGRGRPRKNASKTLLVERKLTDLSTREQGKQSSKAKEKIQEDEDLDLESDDELNWPDLSNIRASLTTPIKPNTIAMPGLNTGAKGTHATMSLAGDASTSRPPSNGTVKIDSPKEQTRDLNGSEKSMQEMKATKIGNGVRSWAGLFSENKLAAKGMNLSYIPPVIHDGEVVIQLLEEDIDE